MHRDGKSTYNVTMWRVGVTFVAVKTRQCIYFLIHDTIIGKIFIEDEMFVLIFSTTFVRNISHSKRDIIINLQRFSFKVLVILFIF